MLLLAVNLVSRHHDNVGLLTFHRIISPFCSEWRSLPQPLCHANRAHSCGILMTYHLLIYLWYTISWLYDIPSPGIYTIYQHYYLVIQELYIWHRLSTLTNYLTVIMVDVMADWDFWGSLICVYVFTGLQPGAFQALLPSWAHSPQGEQGCHGPRHVGEDHAGWICRVYWISPAGIDTCGNLAQYKMSKATHCYVTYF